MLSKLAKDALRAQFLEKRRGISAERREQASTLSFTYLKQWLEDFSSKKILSFAPFKDEIDLWPLNRWILKERQLILPRVEKEHLSLFIVTDLQDLKPSKLGILEPTEGCVKVDPKEVEVALVPGVAFDNRMHRLGYGKGYYDKLLHQMRIPKLGVGFKEQLMSEPIPTGSHDIELTHRFLF